GDHGDGDLAVDVAGGPGHGAGIGRLGSLRGVLTTTGPARALTEVEDGAHGLASALRDRGALGEHDDEGTHEHRGDDEDAHPFQTDGTSIAVVPRRPPEHPTPC